MRDSLSFWAHKLTVSELGALQLITTTSGHLTLSAKIEEEGDQKQMDIRMCFPAKDKVVKVLAASEIMKIHIQLWHCQARQLIATLETSGYRIQRENITSIIKKCGCGPIKSRSYVSVANSHISPYPGYALFLDVIYLRPDTGHQHPYLLILDTFSRFLVCVPSNSIKNHELIRLFEVQWVFFLGLPKFIVRDGGPGLIGGAWTAYGKLRCIALVCNPTNTPSQMGALERHVALLKLALVKIRLRDSAIPFEESVRMA